MTKDDEVGRLCLGTVQMGMRYGVNNALGRQPSREECFGILQAALDEGIDCFDTASAYGNAEEILGQFGLATQNTASGDSVKIISKLRAGCEDTGEAVLREIQQSLQRLHAESLYGYMLHCASDMRNKGIVEGMMRAKKEGMVQKIGVSVYEPGEAWEAVRDMRFDMVQIPCNVLDNRWEKEGFFMQAEECGIEVHVRSVFLQGLLLMNPEQAECKIRGSGTLIEQFREIARNYGFAPKEAAFLFIYSQKGVSRLVFGVDSCDQLQDNCAVAGRTESFEDCKKALHERFSARNIPREIFVPSLWNC